MGEAYVAPQHHYGVSKQDARASLHALTASIGPGFFDRLIANDYAQAGLDTLTLDRSMASLPQTRLISQ